MTSITHDYFQPAAILLTGGAGFIGSHVAIRIAQKYPSVKIVVYDSLEYCASLQNLDAIADAPNFCFIKGDIRSADLVRHVIADHNIDTIMHFAAQTHVDNSFGNSIDFTVRCDGAHVQILLSTRAHRRARAVETFADSLLLIFLMLCASILSPQNQMANTVGTHVLLECARDSGKIKRFINVSTDEVYGETSLGKSEGLTEHSVLDPTNPYSAAKAGAEMLCRAYMTSYKLPIIITRGNNVYGPHQFPEKMIPKFSLLASKDLPLPIHGDGMSMRSYLHVHDVAAAFELILFKGSPGEVYNIGTQKERSVLSVAQEIASHFDRQLDSSVCYVKDRAFNDRRYFICDKKLLQMGWRESVEWSHGLKETIEWYLKKGGNPAYWENGDLNCALAAHPRMLDNNISKRSDLVTSHGSESPIIVTPTQGV
jgi:UDP-glucose 4,6-dehydratase